uniref:Putative secreted peptide n=1 Tax=Anopheles braziliensis TaxID=58242 RepID=A0A2M3ZWX7_9DIPT
MMIRRRSLSLSLTGSAASSSSTAYCASLRSRGANNNNKGNATPFFSFLLGPRTRTPRESRCPSSHCSFEDIRKKKTRGCPGKG